MCLRGVELQIAFGRDARHHATAETRLGHKYGHKMGWSRGIRSSNVVGKIQNGRENRISGNPVITNNKRGLSRSRLKPRPVDCLGLTKRWSLYVASTATPGFLTDLRQADPILIHR